MTIHTVRPHETVTSIARHYHVDVNAIASENNLRNINLIRVGQHLKIPKARNQNTRAISAPKPQKQVTQAHDYGLKKSRLEDFEDAFEQHVYKITQGWLDEMLQRLRHQEANESVQHEAPIKLTPAPKLVQPSNSAPNSKSSYSPHKVNDVKKALQERLGKEPHIITFNGVKLTKNERMQIIAAVATCEMNKDGFGSINADQEFVGRKFGHRGIETGYSRIVHIGLSYGIIQYTQDGGGLGRVLERMRTKNEAEFIRIFGGGSKAVADLLVTTTTTGHPGLAADVPLSGQQYWNSLKSKKSTKSEANEIKRLSMQDSDKDGHSDLPFEREIRGRRVQPISATQGQTPTDIWTGVWKQRFLEAGSVVDFQETQLELAVHDYLNPILDVAAKNKVKSAMALAFITACSVRGGPASPLSRVFYDIANELAIDLPINNNESENKIIDAIISSKIEMVKGHIMHKIGKVCFSEDEVRRMKLLKKDELGFLSEDYYDVSTY